MVKTLKSKERVAKDPVVLRMRKDSGYKYVGNYYHYPGPFVSFDSRFGGSLSQYTTLI